MIELKSYQLCLKINFIKKNLDKKTTAENACVTCIKFPEDYTIDMIQVLQDINFIRSKRPYIYLTKMHAPI